MRRYDFKVILVEGTQITDDLADALYEAGCDDGFVGSSGGVASIVLHRDADSLETAIRSGIADVQKAGCRVVRVEIEEEDLPPAGAAAKSQIAETS